MKGKCTECEERTTFTRVEDLDEENAIVKGSQLLNSMLDEDNPVPEVICDNCGAGLRIADID